MEFTEMDEVRVRTYGGAIGTIEKVVYEMVDGKETDNVYCYEMEINGKHGVMVDIIRGISEMCQIVKNNNEQLRGRVEKLEAALF